MVCFNKFTRLSLCFALCALLLLPPFLAPKRAEAVPIAIPIVVGVGSVIATALAAYGVSSVSNTHTTADIGAEFMTWLDTKVSQDFWDSQTDIKSAQMAINGIYQMGLDGSINLAEWTYNEQNAINGVYGELLQMWAADNFGLNVSQYNTVSIGDYSFSTFYSDVSANSLTGVSWGSGRLPIGATGIFQSGDVAFYEPFDISAPALVTSTVDDGFALSRITNQNMSRQSVQLNQPHDMYNASSNSVLANQYVNSNYFSLSSIALNTYYSIAIYQTDYALAPIVAYQPVHTDNTTVNASYLVALYDAATGVWTSTGAWAGQEVSVASPDAINYGPWADSLVQGINDLLQNYIPVGADHVFNPTIGALEQQGSIPVLWDWTSILDWADVLSNARAGTIDGTRAIDGTSEATGVNAATGEISWAPADIMFDTPYISFNPEGSLPGAIDYTGQSMLGRFPFCTIRDMQALSDLMNRPSRAPVFYLPIVRVDSGGGFVVDSVPISLEPWEPVAVVLRVMIGLLIILGFLRVATRQLKVFNEE